MSPTAAAFAAAPTEVVGDVFRLVDVSALLPRRSDYPARHQAIARIVVHQTQGNVQAVPGGLVAEANYFIREPSREHGVADGRGWPGFAYTFWVPFQPLLDEDRRFVVYRCQPDQVVSNHTHRANEDGVAVAFQGRFASVGNPDAGGPSHAQLILFPSLLRYLLGRYRLGAAVVAPHSAFTKPDCPGFELERQIRLLQGKGNPS